LNHEEELGDRAFTYKQEQTSRLQQQRARRKRGRQEERDYKKKEITRPRQLCTQVCIGIWGKRRRNNYKSGEKS
jgi:hypothetical protein